MVDLENDNLWLLLLKQALHGKLLDNEEKKSSLFLETIYFRILKAGCPNL